MEAIPLPEWFSSPAGTYGTIIAVRATLATVCHSMGLVFDVAQSPSRAPSTYHP
jgi:hypothetical protein